MEYEFILRIFVAALLGGLIGLEREYRAKEAGFRTHFLVALGAALFMIVSAYGFGDSMKGIRINRLKAGDITVRNAFEIDPYGSNIATLTMRGDELEQFLIGYGQMNTYKFPHLGGMRADLTVDYEGSNDIVGVKLMALDGKRFDRRKTYRVVTNTYVLATNKTPLSATPTTLNMTTSDAILDFLSRQPSVNYQGKSKLNYLTK